MHRAAKRVERMKRGQESRRRREWRDEIEFMLPDDIDADANAVQHYIQEQWKRHLGDRGPVDARTWQDEQGHWWVSLKLKNQ